jgi:hypothetical protein
MIQANREKQSEKMSGSVLFDFAVESQEALCRL